MSNQNPETKNGSSLPDFMSEGNKLSYIEENDTENSWLNNNKPINICFNKVHDIPHILSANRFCRCRGGVGR